MRRINWTYWVVSGEISVSVMHLNRGLRWNHSLLQPDWRQELLPERNLIIVVVIFMWEIMISDVIFVLDMEQRAQWMRLPIPVTLHWWKWRKKSELIILSDTSIFLALENIRELTFRQKHQQQVFCIQLIRWHRLILQRMLSDKTSMWQWLSWQQGSVLWSTVVIIMNRML